MKFIKTVTIAAAFFVALLLASWLWRNSLIQRFSGPLLAEFDIELTDVSLDVLAARDAQIGYLELVHAKGTTVTIEGLTLPIGRAADGLRKYTADKVSIVTATRAQGEPFELARLIDQYLSLPEHLSGSELKVAELSLPPYPTLRNLQWNLTPTEQTLRTTIASIDIEVGTTRIGEREFEIGFSQSDMSGDEHSVSGHLRRSSYGLAIAGGASIQLDAWERLVKFAGVVPAPVTITAGNALLEYEVGIPYSTSIPPSIVATLSPTADLQIGYATGDTPPTSVVVTSATPLEIHATFPAVEWQLQQDEALLLISYENWRNIPLRISGIACDSGNRCTMNSAVSMTQADLPFGSAKQISLTSRQILDLSAAGPRLEFDAGAEVTANGFRIDDLHMDSLEATLTSAASISFVTTGWQIDANAVDLRLESLSVGDDLLLSGPLFLENVTLANLSNVATTKLEVLVLSPRVESRSIDTRIPGLQGSISQLDDDVEFDFATIDLHENGDVQGIYNLGSGNGKLTIADSAVSFADAHLSSWPTRWNKDWDIVAGTVAVAGEIAWLKNNVETLSGQLRLGVTDLAGFVGDTAFTGLSTDLDVTYDGKGSGTVLPASASVALIDVGLPLRDLTVDYVLSPDFRGADVSDLRMNAFAGVISAEPFSIHTDKASNNVIVRAESLDMSDILTLKEFDAIEVSGRIGAELPVTISTEGITIAAGSLTGEEPGGVIRYLSGKVTNGTTMSSIDTVREALSHFRYDTLTSDLSYSKDGDLELAMQLKGRNPDMEGSRPVILNLNVQNNVPQMLKSLQAARAVEELLERQLAQ